MEVTNRIWSFCFDLSVARNYGRLKHPAPSPCTWPALRFEALRCSMGGESVSAPEKSQMRETPMVKGWPEPKKGMTVLLCGQDHVTRCIQERSLSSYNLATSEYNL